MNLIDVINDIINNVINYIINNKPLSFFLNNTDQHEHVTFRVRSFWYQNNSWNFTPWNFTLSWAPGCGAFSFPKILPGGRSPVSAWECECVKQFFPVLGHPKTASFRPGQGDMVGNQQKIEVLLVLTNFQASLGAGHRWLFSKILEKHGWAWCWCLPIWVRSENPVPTRGGVVVLDFRRVLPWTVHDSSDGRRIILTLVGVEDILGAESALTHHSHPSLCSLIRNLAKDRKCNGFYF